MSCWSCGQKANGSCMCTVCNVAKYCGPLCLHKDWDSHQKVCGLTKARPSFRPPATGASTPPATAPEKKAKNCTLDVKSGI